MDRHKILLTAALLILDVCIVDRCAAQKPYGQQITDSLWLYRDEVTWEEAFRSCQNMAASLALHFTIDELFAAHEVINSPTQFWIGHYLYITPWMYSTGCFSFDNKNFTRIENNDIHSCKLKCGHSDIMVQKDKCLCVKKAPDIDARKSRSFCNVRCPGNPSEFCGGNDVYLHYTANKQHMYDGFDCGIYDGFNIASTYCGSRRPFLCVPFDNDTSGKSLNIVSEENTFIEAVELCYENGSYLVDPITLNASQFTGTGSFWVDIRRIRKYVAGHALPTDSRNCLCQRISNQHLLYLDYGLINCSETAPYLCRKHKQAQTTMATINGTANTSESTSSTEMSKWSAIKYMWIYFAGGAGLFIVVFIVVVVIGIILLTRIRREMIKRIRTTESIPLTTLRHDHTYTVLTANQSETSRRAMSSNRKQYESIESVMLSPVPHCSGTDMFGPGRDGNKVLAKAQSCGDLTGSHHYSDVSKPRNVQASFHDFDTQTRSRRLCDDGQTGISGMARCDISDSNGNGSFNNSHQTHSRNSRQTNDFNIHPFESSIDGWYQKLPKPGHKHRVQDDASAYDRCSGLSFDKGSKGNGNDS